MEHLDRVTDYEEHNQMTADSLSVVFCPNLLRSSNNDIGFFFANMSSAHRTVKLLITHVRVLLLSPEPCLLIRPQFHIIFDDAEPEQEVESDEEFEPDHFDEPILEEEEEEDVLTASQDNQELTPSDEDDLEEDADEDRTYRYPESTNIDPPRIDVEIPHIS